MGRSSRRAAPTGFTLIEMMVAVGLTVLMMTMVVTIFGLVMDSIRDSRAAIEVNDRLRAAKNRLQNDLMGLTAPLTPPLNPELGLGYFELIEGPMGPVYHPTEVMPYSVVSDVPDPTRKTGFGADSTVGDLDDILMFTIRSGDEPFVGNAVVATSSGLRVKPIQSRVAEVAWFVRGTTLHRRVLLVATPILLADEQWPTVQQTSNPIFFQNNDLSVHIEGSPDFSGATVDFTGCTVVPNTLSDLTKRENRYAHQPFAWPYDARFWGNLCLPTLEEYSADPGSESGPLDYYSLGQSKNNLWIARTDPSRADSNARKLFVPNTYAVAAAGNPFTEWVSNATDYPLQRLTLSADTTYVAQHFDAWRYPHPAAEQDHSTGQFVKTGTRVGEDVILTDVLSCDVKVWDPGSPIITLNDLSDTNNVNAEALSPGDPPILYMSSGNRVSESAAAYAVNRIATDNGNNDLDQIVGFGAYVDLNYMCRLGPPTSATFKSRYEEVLATIKATAALQKVVSYDPNPPAAQFHHNGDPRSGLMGTYLTALKNPRVVDPPPDPPVSSDFSDQELIPSVYDTYSTSYETDGINQTNVPWLTARAAADTGADGLDTDGDGAVDEKTSFPDLSGENETAPPYAHPLRGIQIKIRVFEPGTRQIREVTLEHEFVSQ